jgi:hypothetical protein
MGVSLLAKPQALPVKTLSYTITLPPELVIRLAKPVTGKGGWQTLMHQIVSQVENDTLELSQGILTEMITKATKHGAGGYQSVIRWILCLLLAQHTTALIGKPETLKALAGGMGKVADPYSAPVVLDSTEVA